MKTTITLLRTSGTLLGHLLTAVIGTAIIESGFWAILQSKGISVMVLKAYLFSITIPFGLGFLVSWKRRSRSANWVWVVGLCWFGSRAISYWIDQGSYRLLGVSHSVFWEMSGVGCTMNTAACWDFIGATIPSMRTFSYSAGAWICSMTASPKLLFRRNPQAQDYENPSEHDLRETQEGDEPTMP